MKSPFGMLNVHRIVIGNKLHLYSTLRYNSDIFEHLQYTWTSDIVFYSVASDVSTFLLITHKILTEAMLFII